LRKTAKAKQMKLGKLFKSIKKKTILHRSAKSFFSRLQKGKTHKHQKQKTLSIKFCVWEITKEGEPLNLLKSFQKL